MKILSIDGFPDFHFKSIESLLHFLAGYLAAMSFNSVVVFTIKG
jgi:hypothetical protein